MSEDDPSSAGKALIDILTGVAKIPGLPLQFLKKICSATGLLYEPIHQKRLTNAEAYRIRTLAQAEMDGRDIRQRAELRGEAERLRHQQNMEAITALALPHLKEEEAKPEKVEDDWINDFFGMCRNVSDEGMRAVWARVLAGEFNNPGGYSRRTLRILQDFDKEDAEILAKFKGLSIFMYGRYVPIVENKHDYLRRFGVIWLDLSHLEDIGVGRLDATGVSWEAKVPIMEFRYFDKKIALDFNQPPSNYVPLGNVFWSKTGQELLSICEAEPNDDFLKYLMQTWKGLGTFTVL